MISKQSKDLAFFLDISGSVGGSQNYWGTVKDILAEYGQYITHWYGWDTSIKESNKKEIEKFIDSKYGGGGTSPELVAQKVAKQGLRNIILITDGQVSDSSVQKCDQILQNYQLAKSICYIISSGSSSVNMSVTCPFTRNCDNVVFSKKKNEPLQKLVQHTPQDFKMLDELDEINLENFNDKFDKLESLIIAINMGKSGNIPLKNELVIMKNRLVKQLSLKHNQENQNPSEKIIIALQKNDIQTALKQAKALSHAYFNDDMTTSLQKKVSHLINLCGDLKGKYNLNQIKSNKIAIAQTAEKSTKVDEVEIVELSKNTIQCPIIMQEDIPQILVDESDEPVLLNVDKNIVSIISDCPLRILNYPEIKQKFKKRLGNFIGVKYGDKFLKNPFTQRKILGSIPLGCHHSHVKVGNYTLANMLTGGKILGNLNLYYAVIWFLIKENNIQYLKDIQKNAAEHLIFRLKNSQTMISLCGLAQFVTTKARSDVAVWYCVNSGYLNQPTDRDTFRFHTFNMKALIEINELLGYPIVKGTKDHLRRTYTMMKMLSMVKKLNPVQLYQFKCKMQCLYQKAMIIDKQKIKKDVQDVETCSSVIPIDGQATQEQIKKIIQMLPKTYQKCPLQELYYISKLVSPSKSASDIFLDFNLTIQPLPKFQVNWAYKLTQLKHVPLKICPKTLRPYYNINGKVWEEVAQQTYKIKVRYMLMGLKYFQHFMLKYERLPQNGEQLATFYFNRYVVSGKKKTLPFMIQQWCPEILADYINVFKDGFDFKHVKTVLFDSLRIQKRIALEKQIEK